MKYIVIAALLATNTQAYTWCRKGLSAQVYSDEKCQKPAYNQYGLLPQDVAKTGKCEIHTASEEDIRALEFAKDVFQDKQKEAREANMRLQRSMDIDVEDANGNKGPANEIFEEHYTELRTAYFKHQQSMAIIKKYIDEHGADGYAIKEYAREYYVLYKLQAMPKEDQDEAAIDAQKELVEQLYMRLPRNLDPKLIEQAVVDLESYKALLNKYIDPSQQQNVQKFLQLDWANVEAQAALKKQQNILRTAQDKVDAHTYSQFVACDYKSYGGIRIQVYDRADCNGAPEQEYSAKWGQCTKWGDAYYKITDYSSHSTFTFAGFQF